MIFGRGILFSRNLLCLLLWKSFFKNKLFIIIIFFFIFYKFIKMLYKYLKKLLFSYNDKVKIIIIWLGNDKVMLKNDKVKLNFIKLFLHQHVKIMIFSL